MKKYIGYKFTKHIGKFARDKFAPNPTKSLDKFGRKGKVIGKFFNKLTAKPIHNVSFGLTGLAYDKKKHPSWIGSLIYTVCFFVVVMLLSLIISLLVG